VKVGQIELGQALIEEGLVPGEQVVVDGQYKLQPGALVKIAEATGEGGTTNRPTSVTEKIGSIGPAM
jgi:hypothetical protein